MPIRRRLILLTTLSAIGGLLFVPFLIAGAAGEGAKIPSPSIVALIVTLVSTMVGGSCAWAGLRFADRANLPMPLLRSWEQGLPAQADAWSRTLKVSLFTGAIAGAAIFATVHVLRVPANPGGLLARLLTAVFAATVPEVIVHLFAMSGLVLIWRKNWPAILLSSALFVLLFHGGHVGSAMTTAFVLGANFAFGTLTGWLYSRYGLETAILTHAVGHLLVVGWN